MASILAGRSGISCGSVGGDLARPRGPTGGLLGDPLPEDQLDRRAQEAVLGPDPVLQVAPIAEVDQLRVVDEDHEGGRPDRDLRRVQDLRLPVADVRRRMGAHGVGHQPVQLAGRDATEALLGHAPRLAQDALDALAGLRRGEHDVRPGQVRAPRGAGS